MTREEHQQIDFLIKAFARYCGKPDVIVLFQEQYGKEPTRRQLAMTNLGPFLNDKRRYFKENSRMTAFRKERAKYEASKENWPLYSPAWRMEQYQKHYDRAAVRAEETGNPSRCLGIMEQAAKDIAGFYSPKTQINNIDNRSVSVNMSDEAINKKLRLVFQQFGIDLPDMPVIERGATVIEHDGSGGEE